MLLFSCAGLSQTINARNIETIFLTLPDSFFINVRTAHHDSFPPRERRWLMDSGSVEGARSRWEHFFRVEMNQKTQTLRVDEQMSDIVLRAWKMANGKTLLCHL